MSSTTLELAAAAADGDSTHAALIFAPAWIDIPNHLPNSLMLSVDTVDTAGIAHKPGSKCWGRPNMRKAGQVKLVVALEHRKLCDRGCI